MSDFLDVSAEIESYVRDLLALLGENPPVGLLEEIEEVKAMDLPAEAFDAADYRDDLRRETLEVQSELLEAAGFPPPASVVVGPVAYSGLTWHEVASVFVTAPIRQSAHWSNFPGHYDALSHILTELQRERALVVQARENSRPERQSPSTTFLPEGTRQYRTPRGLN